MTNTTRVTLKQQLEEVEREIRKRGEVYPRQVRLKKMRQGEADELIRRMEAVRSTLRFLVGSNVPDDLPPPASMILALIHIRRILPKADKGQVGEIRKVIEDALTGIPLPVIVDKDKAKTALQNIGRMYANQDIGHLDFRVAAKREVDEALS